MKTNKKIIWLVCIVSIFAVLLTAYIMPFLEKEIASLKIEENAMLRGFLIEFIIRPVIASVISIFMFYLGLTFLRRLGIYTESSTLLIVLFTTLVVNIIVEIIQYPWLLEWLIKM